MARIKVTGYIDTEDMSPSDVDLTHAFGVSTEFFDRAVTFGVTVYEPEFELTEE